MHIPNAVLDPRVAAATGLIGAAGLGYALNVLARRLGDRTPVLMGTMAAFVFAAQMVNFPVGPMVSGHLLGGVLAAVMLGPWAGAVVIAAVLIVQCLLFGDGGLTALGANFVNIGLIGSVGGYAIYAPVRRLFGGKQGVVLAAMVAAWFTVLLASGAFTVELVAFGRRADFARILGWMTLIHSAIGLGEAVITGLVVRFILQTRPDLLYDPMAAWEGCGPGPAARWAGSSLAGLAVALAVGVFLAPLASEHPDGLEYVGKRLGFLPSETPRTAPVPIPEYRPPVPGFNSLGAATAAAGAFGTVVVFGVGLLIARAFGPRPRSRDEEAVGRGRRVDGVNPNAA